MSTREAAHPVVTSMCTWCKLGKQIPTVLVSLSGIEVVKKWRGLKSLGEKSCEVKDGSQEMAAMMLMLINFNNVHNHC